MTEVVEMTDTPLERWERQAKARGFVEPPINAKALQISQGELKARVLGQLKNTPEWKKLITDLKRFERRLRPLFDENAFYKWVDDPDNLNNILTSESGVMDAKSSSAKTLRADTNAAIERAGLKRKPQGQFRGMDSPDWDAYAKSLGYTESTYDKKLFDVVYSK